MGMYANHADVHHPTEEFELGDCTACQGTGWVDYPINVTVGEDEQDPCPYGCEPEEDRPGYYTDYEAETTLEDELMDAWYASKRPVEEIDPFLVLSKAAKKVGLKPYVRVEAPKRRALVSSDVDLMGLVEDDLHKSGDGLLIYPCTVPAYLAGEPLTYLDGILRVQYQYLGSNLIVRFGQLETEFLRFAYSWDNDFATSQLLT